jgi:CubicO group peptidase (beta-lactamase class C family)
MNKSKLSRTRWILILLLGFYSVDYGAGPDQTRVENIDQLVQSYHDLRRFSGTVLVAEAGKVIYKKGFGMANHEWGIPNRPDTKFRLGSITKQFTAMLVLQLVAENKIDLEGKLSDYLPYYRKDTGAKVTVHHLLTHTSGIPSYTGLPDFMEEISRDPYEVDDFVRTYCSGDLEFEPGSRFVYNNSGYFLLGAILEKTTGKTYAEVLQERIFEPLGMKDSGYDRHDTIISHRATGYNTDFDGYTNSPYMDMSLPYAAGSLYSTVEDIFIWDQALYTNKLLEDELKQLYFKPHVPAMGAHYAYGWVVMKKKFPKSDIKLTSIAHGGGINGFNTLIERLVDDRHLIVLLNNTPGASLAAMSDAITRILYGLPHRLPIPSIADAIYPALRESGVEAALERYRKLKEEHPRDYMFPPRELNRLGYHLLNNRKSVDDAIAVFKFNVEIYPRYANGFDSLAGAYMAKGDKTAAIKNYAKALELDPKNANALAKLNELMKEE